MEHEVEPPLRSFTPSNGNLKILESYGHQLGDDYWAVLEKKCYREERGSMIDQKKMEEIAKRLEIPDKAKVQRDIIHVGEWSKPGHRGRREVAIRGTQR